MGFESFDIANDLAVGIIIIILTHLKLMLSLLKLLKQTEQIDDENDLSAIRIYKVDQVSL